MPVKLGRKQLPSGYACTDFKYMGRPARDQGDFSRDVGIADMACVNQFGQANNAKHYHGGVVQSGDGNWWVYLEWGRIRPGKSWVGAFGGQDFQFVRCTSEQEARAFFAKQMHAKNTRRLVKKTIHGQDIWAGKSGKDGYIVQRLATRERGLPDAYTIKDDTGIVQVKVTAKPATSLATPALTRRRTQHQVAALARDLVQGTVQYARAASAATGVIPTMDAIEEVRNELLPLALREIARIGQDVRRQIQDPRLIDISKLVAALVPRPIPRGRSGEQRARASILSTENILTIQQDLDAFESALKNEDFRRDEASIQQPMLDPDDVLGARLTWLDPSSRRGRWLTLTAVGMTNNRHGYLSKRLKIRNMFAVARPQQDAAFEAAVTQLAHRRKGRFQHRARLQPSRRPDLGDFTDVAKQANVFLGIHGTRAVNVHPIMKTNLRLPRQLQGVHISGAAFGHGIYFATDWKKSYGYTGHGNACYGGGGQISGRGFFMFLGDVAMGKGHMTRTTGSWTAPPRRCDSIAAYPEYSSVANDEHIIFNPNHQRIRYLIEGELR